MKLSRRAFAMLAAGAAASPRLALAAADPATAFVDRLPPYRPAVQVSGRVRLWGHGSPTQANRREWRCRE